jgi:DNA-binding NarL/FixJ family response regulator
MEVAGATAVVSSSHAVIEGVLRLTAASVPGIDRVTPISDRDRLVEEIAQTAATIAVIDLDPTEAGALDMVRDLSAVAQGGVSVVLLTDRVDGAFALAAMRSGVRGLVLKPDALRELAPVLRRVIAGERVIDPALDDASVTSLGRFARQAREGSRAEAMLSPREMEILLLMGDGLTMQQIARRLGISPRTVETHATNLYRKLDVRTRVQAVAKAATIGLIEMG